MGQGGGGRACCGWPAAGAAGQFEIAAVTPRRTWAARAAPGGPPSARVSAAWHRPGVKSLPKWRARTTAPAAGVGGPPQPMTATAPLWPAEVDGAPSAGVGGPPQPGTRRCLDLAGQGRRRARPGCPGTCRSQKKISRDSPNYWCLNDLSNML